MSARSWYTVKYVADLMRDEPRNVGVILVEDGAARLRFLGERPDGSIDGRQLNDISSVDAFKLWVQHWRRLSESSDDVVASLDSAGRRAIDNYFLSSRVDAVITGDQTASIEDATDRLFRALVSDDPVAPVTLRERVESAFRSLSVDGSIEEDFEVRVRHDAATWDTLHFDYRFKGARQNLMERINLETVDRRTWNKVHAASWNFNRVDDGGATRCISLVKTGSSDRRAQLETLHLLERTSDVVDFAGSAPEAELADLLAS